MSSDEEGAGSSRRSRRSRGKRYNERQAALEKLQNARQTGRCHREDVNELVQDIYEEVDEEEFSERVGTDFVIDDDGAGYVDHGEDIFEDGYVDEEEQKKEKKRKERKEQQSKKKGGIASFFSVAAPKPKNEPDGDIKNDTELEAMLAELDQADDVDPAAFAAAGEAEAVEEDLLPQESRNKFKRAADVVDFAPRPVKLPRLAKRRRSPPSKPAAVVKPDPVMVSATAPITIAKAPSFSDDQPGIGDDYHDHAFDDDPPRPPSVTMDDVDFEAAEEITEESKPVKSLQGFAPSSQMKHDLSSLADFENSLVDTLTLPSSTTVNPEESSTAEAYLVSNEKGDQILRFYWIDAFEDLKNAGRVYLFGFVKTAPSTYQSCCVVVNGITHRICFVPRSTHADTGEAVQMHDVYLEVKELLVNNYRVSTFKSTQTKRKFAFGDVVDATEEVLCLETFYDANYPAVTPEATNRAKTFCRVANSTVTALERLIVERSIRGPCWLEISGVVETTTNGIRSSTTEREWHVAIISPKLSQINVLTAWQDEPMPSARLLSFNVVTMAHKSTKKPEIVLISLLHSNQYSFVRASVTGTWDRRVTLLAPPTGTVIPFSFAKDAERRRVPVEKLPNEKALLNRFLAEIKKIDPDVLVGHDLAGQLALLRERMEEKNIPANLWSALGRLRRKTDEKLKNQPQNKQFRWAFTAGRLCLDSKSAATELVHSQSYDLDELVQKVLLPVDPQARRLAIDASQIERIFEDTSGKTDPIFNLIMWSALDAQFAHRVLSQLNAMPLFVQITQIVGGILSRTLMGGRAERNEYLLLHAFFKDDYVAPDRALPFHRAIASQKSIAGGKAKIEKKETCEDEAEEPEGTGGPAAVATTNKKAQYTGGLVLEPKKGLYETFIVLLDFNSLYPSIIQEFNICFTTVKMGQRDQANESELPPLPEKTPQGILPREIAKLVCSRQEVKKEMKKCSDKSSERYVQYNIRQLGLKLTANSMYGCLGFDGSRFCAKTLAAMVTSKGREILEATRTMVENSGFSVIYGDTDSIMVNTNTINFGEARTIGNTIKQLINKSYTKLVLDIDGVYKRLLLLKKKKYAGLAIDLADPSRATKELKGLDIVRRDWSVLARDVGSQVVDIILGSQDHDEMVQAIKDLLAKTREDITTGRVELHSFEILKKLTHRPEAYRDAKSQPHVIVALRLNAERNASLRNGDVVKYIICSDGSNSAATQRAYAFVEVEDNKELKIDTDYYLAHQIHPVVSRLCEPIEDIDACQIAEALGLDPSGYKRRLREAGDDDSGYGDENAEPGIQHDFNACEGISITCRQCQRVDIHRSVINDAGKLAFVECQGCGFDFMTDTLGTEIQIVENLNRAFQKLKSNEYVCDDLGCGHVLPFKPLKKTATGYPCVECQSGFYRSRFSAKRLYDQQCFFQKIVNLDAFLSSEAKQDQKVSLNALSKIDAIKHAHKTWCNRIGRVLGENSYNRVDLSSIFGNMITIQ